MVLRDTGEATEIVSNFFKSWQPFFLLGGLILAIILYSYRSKKHTAAKTVVTVDGLTPVKHPSARAIPLKVLQECTGSRKDAPILMGIYMAKYKNVVIFDVSSKPHFYGPGGGYNCLAGRDASRCLATMDLQTSATDISQISAEEFRTLMQWTTKFEGDYPIVGHLEVESAKACGKTLLGTIREAGDEGIQLGDASDLPPFPTAATTSSSSSSSTTSTALPIPFPFLSASTLATSSKGSDSPPLAPKPRQRIPGFPVPS